MTALVRSHFGSHHKLCAIPTIVIHYNGQDEQVQKVNANSLRSRVKDNDCQRWSFTVKQTILKPQNMF